MDNNIRIPNVAVFEHGDGTTYRQITSYAEVTPEIARQIVAAVVPEDMHRLCLELDKAKFMARLEALEGRTSAIAEIQRDDHEKGMAGRISALEARLLAQEIWSQAPAPVDAGPVTFAPGWHCPHCNTDIPGGQYHDCKEEKRQETDAEDRSCGLTPPADDAAVEELRCWSVGYEYYHDAYFSEDAPSANQRPTAESLAESLQHGARLVSRAIQAKDAEIAALRAEVDAAKADAEQAKAERNKNEAQWVEMQRAGDIRHLRKLTQEANEARAEVAEGVGLLREARTYMTTGKMFRQDDDETQKCRRIDAFLARVDAPNAQGQPAATEPAQQAGRGPLGCADLLGADV